MPKHNILFKVDINREKFDSICTACLPQVVNSSFEKTRDGFLLKEKTDLLNGKYGVTADIRYHNDQVIIEARCSGIGPVQKKHVYEIAEIIQNLIQRGIKENITECKNNGPIRCPKCGSTQIQLVKRGWTATTGLVASSKNERVCMKCLYKF